jgi:transcriptional regulator with XRE-family HTH domain
MKTLNIRDILAPNLKENRKKCGLTHEKLAEKAGISAHYLAMVEAFKNFPTPEMLDRIAQFPVAFYFPNCYSYVTERSVTFTYDKN